MSIISPFPLTHDKDVTPDRVSRKPRVSALLQIPCGCEDGWVWQPRRGGNDPDGRMVRCDAPLCDDGLVTPPCDMCNCVGWATDSVDGTFVCEQCAPVFRAEAVTERLAGLTSWSRAVVLHHMRTWLRLPSGSLEMAEVGREITEDGCGEWFRLPRDEQTRIAMTNEP